VTTRTTGSALLRLAAALALVLALVGGEPSHGHAPFSSPDLCAACSFSMHAPTIVGVAFECGHAPEPTFAIAETEIAPAASAFRHPTRSRAPPFA
jgi:hypothetical protein